MLTSIYTTRLRGVKSYSILELATTFNVASHLTVTIRNLFNNVSSTLQIIASYNSITVNWFGKVSKRVVAYYNYHICENEKYKPI
jgi:hypothetical protein